MEQARIEKTESAVARATLALEVAGRQLARAQAELAALKAGLEEPEVPSELLLDADWETAELSAASAGAGVEWE